MPENPAKKPVRIGILGAGVAGLSSACFLQKYAGEKRLDVEVYEATDKVGGLARSFKWHGVWCDLAPHRLYTQDKQLLHELMQLVPMHQVSRKSKIFIQNKWIKDPVNPLEILLKFFPKRSFSILFSYLRVRIVPSGDENSFEGLVLKRFGTGLNEIFFKPYSEKLFGIPANKISAEWGKRKIRVSGIKDMLKKNTKLYFNTFYYPNNGGYGAISQKLYQCVTENVHLETKVIAVKHNNVEPDTEMTESYTCTFERSDGEIFVRDFDVLISTLPLNKFSPLLGLNIDLTFRAARMVYLNVNKANLSEMHWFYVADAGYMINRVAEFKNFSHDHDAADNSVLCVEVTAQQNFSIKKTVSELEQLGILCSDDVIDTKIIDIPCAYPIYDLSYSDQTKRAMDFFRHHPDIHLLGRSAQFSHVDVDEIFYAAKVLTKYLLKSLG